MEGSNSWRYKTQNSYTMLITWRRPEEMLTETWWNNNNNYQDNSLQKRMNISHTQTSLKAINNPSVMFFCINFLRVSFSEFLHEYLLSIYALNMCVKTMIEKHHLAANLIQHMEKIEYSLLRLFLRKNWTISKWNVHCFVFHRFISICCCRGFYFLFCF